MSAKVISRRSRRGGAGRASAASCQAVRSASARAESRSTTSVCPAGTTPGPSISAPGGRYGSDTSTGWSKPAARSTFATRSINPSRTSEVPGASRLTEYGALSVTTTASLLTVTDW